MNRFYIYIIVLALLTPKVSSVESSAANPVIQVFIDDKLIEFDVDPITRNGRALVPVRAVYEALGLEVGWEEDTQKVTGTKEGLSIVMTIEQSVAYVNGEAIVLDQAPILYEHRTLVPVRFIAESTGATVDWDEVRWHVLISSNAEPEQSIDYDALGYKELNLGQMIAEKYEERYFYDDIDMGSWDLSEYYVGDLLGTSFVDSVTMPSLSHMPVNLDLNTLFETYKKPGMNIDLLHQRGLTGAGVRVAYIDQPLNLNHDEFSDVNIHYFNTTGNTDSMHGPAVLGILAGKNCGVAPEADVYYIAHKAWLADQRTHAEALYQLVDINQDLPDDNKIRMVGFSDNIDPGEAYPEALQEAVEYAETNGIMVFFCETIDYSWSATAFGEDINNPDVLIEGFTEETVHVPTRRSLPAPNSDTSYLYYDLGGASWTTPYVLGLFAIGLQVNPELTKEQLIQYLMMSRHESMAINPVHFVELIELDMKVDKRYIILYNSLRMSEEDLDALDEYIKFYDPCVVDLIDTKDNEVEEIYGFLADKSEAYKEEVIGLQILGTDEIVPAFDMSYQVLMANGNIDDMGTFKTDFFYANLNNQYDSIESFTVMDWYEGGMDSGVDLIPQWPVSRLPLSTGEFSAYLNKYMSYQLAVEEPYLVNISNPIFSSTRHIDDFSYFIKYRLDQEFEVLDDDQYSLYGNKEGAYPVLTPGTKEMSKENISMENEENICDFMINTHGQSDNIDQAIYASSSSESEYRKSFLNIADVNEVLDGNYYNMYLWTCNNALDMDDNNMVHEMMFKGQAINMMASTTVLSNNGVDNQASMEELKHSNFYYYYYTYFRELFTGNTRANSYYEAEKAYITSFIESGDIVTMEANPQFAVSNVFLHNFFGLQILEPSSLNEHVLFQYSLEKNDKTTEEEGSAVDYEATHLIEIVEEVQNIPFTSLEFEYYDGSDLYVDISLSEIYQDTDDVFFHLVGEREETEMAYIFIAGDGEGLGEILPLETTFDIYFKLPRVDYDAFEENIVINMGNRNFIVLRTHN